MANLHPPAVGLSRDTRASIGVACVFAAAYSLYGLLRHWRFDSSYDLGIFDQAVWHLSRLERPASSLRGYSNLMGDHFSPIISLFAPLYWIAPRVETLIVAQALLLAASIVPVFLYARERLPRGAAMALAIAYGLFWGLQRAAGFDVHEVAFAPLAISALIFAMARRAWPWFWAAAVVVVLIKEELIALLVFAGAYLIVRGEHRRGAILLASSVVLFVAIVGTIIPWAAGAREFGYLSAYAGVIERPSTIVEALVTPRLKLLTAFLWVAPFALLPLLSPLATWLTPFAFIRFLSASTNHWGTIFHYSAPIAPILGMAAADGLRRIAGMVPEPARRTRTVTALAASTVVLSAVLPGHQPLWRLFSPDSYRLTTLQRTGEAAVRSIPFAATVATQAAVAPHMTHRDAIYLIDDRTPDTDYVIAAAGLSPWPWATEHDLMAIVSSRRQLGYITVFEQDGWVILRRSDSRK